MSAFFGTVAVFTIFVFAAVAASAEAAGSKSTLSLGSGTLVG